MKETPIRTESSMKKVLVLIMLVVLYTPFSAFAEAELKGKYEVIGDLL